MAEEILAYPRDVIEALLRGFVDVKVCAADENVVRLRLMITGMEGSAAR